MKKYDFVFSPPFEAKFHDIVIFNGVWFKKKSYFTNVLFEGKTYFPHCHFLNETNFDRAKFKNEVIFSGTEFREKVKFSNAKFYAMSIFSSIFSIDGDYITKFKSADFNSTHFEKGVSFNYCIIEKN